VSDLIVAADLRWPKGTGIGVCATEYLARLPVDMSSCALQLRSGIGHPISPFELGARLALHQKKHQVFWNPGFVPPAWSRAPSVVTVHDLTHLHYYSSLHVRYYNTVFRPMYRRCSAVVCVSEYTRSEFLDWSGMDPGQVHVVHNGVSSRFHAHVEPHRPGYPYILYPGNMRSYKNVEMLLRAFTQSSLRALGLKVVLTGTGTPELLATIAALGIAEHVVFLGFVPDERLPGLYRGASFTAFISLYEGFGLPIVESMAVGTPVLTSNVSSMPEIAGDAAVIVQPRDLGEIANAMDRLVSDSALRVDLVAKGLERAATFSWDRAATQAWGIVRSAARQR